MSIVLSERYVDISVNDATSWRNSHIFVARIFMHGSFMRRYAQAPVLEKISLMTL